MPRPTPAPTQKKGEPGFVSPTREPEPMTDKQLAQAALEVFEDDLADPGTVQAEIDRLNEQEDKPRGLHAKIAEVAAEAERIPKNGKAPAAMGGYEFVQVGDAADAIRKALSSRGVSMLPESTKIVQLESEWGKNHNMTVVTVETIWRLTDSETGETATIMSLGTGADTGDKYTPKAQTNSMKYALLMGWQLSTGDDPERFDLSEKEQGPGITIGPSNLQGVIQGGRQGQATQVQLEEIRRIAGQKSLTPMALATFIGATLGGKAPEITEDMEPRDQSTAVLAFIGELESAEAGQIVSALRNITT